MEFNSAFKGLNHVNIFGHLVFRVKKQCGAMVKYIKMTEIHLTAFTIK